MNASDPEITETTRDIDALGFDVTIDASAPASAAKPDARATLSPEERLVAALAARDSRRAAAARAKVAAVEQAEAALSIRDRERAADAQSALAEADSMKEAAVAMFVDARDDLDESFDGFVDAARAHAPKTRLGRVVVIGVAAAAVVVAIVGAVVAFAPDLVVSGLTSAALALL